jgi:hypothetical protein
LRGGTYGCGTQIEYANGDLASVATLERRRREVVPPSAADDMHLLLVKYR